MGLSLKKIGKAINKGFNAVVDVAQAGVGSIPIVGDAANAIIDEVQGTKFSGGSRGSTPTTTTTTTPTNAQTSIKPISRIGLSQVDISKLAGVRAAASNQKGFMDYVKQYWYWFAAAAAVVIGLVVWLIFHKKGKKGGKFKFGK